MFRDADPERFAWLAAFRTYLGASAALNLAWEALQLPLYAIWQTGNARELAFAVAHCTLGDVLIALSTLSLGLVIAGHGEWPRRQQLLVAIVAIILGVAYTVYSEHLNVAIRQSWAYADRMPVIRGFGWQIGVSPILQWMVVPTLALWIIARRQRRGQPTPPQ